MAKFPRGWCTSYVASKRNITWRGNAGTWYKNAAAIGIPVGTLVAVGAIYVEPGISSRGCRGCGHVSYVEQVLDDKFLISEMNYVAFGAISTRWVEGSSGLFIY